MRKTLLSIFAFACLLLASGSLQAQCGPYYAVSPDANCSDCATVSLPDTVSGCAGMPVVINPVVTVPTGFTVRDFRWTPILGVSPATGPGVPGTTTITPPAPASPPPCGIVPYSYALTLSAFGPNVVYDGDFSLASLTPPGGSFCTQFVASPPASLGSSMFTICTDANPVPGFVPAPTGYPTTFTDHTTGTGNMLVAVTDPNTNIIWQQDVMVCPDANYEFSFWQACLHSHSGFPLTFADVYVTVTDAGGAVIFTSGPLNNGMISALYDKWDQHVMSFYNPSGNTTATIYIHCGAPIPGAGGNQPFGTTYAIDDISLNRQCRASDNVIINVSYNTIYGPTRVCVGSTIALSSCTPGGVWSSGNTTRATVDGTGVVTGVSGGTVVISYTDPSGCITTHSIRVFDLPVITGPAAVCVNSQITWSSSSGSGTWTYGGGIFGPGAGIGTSQTFRGISPGVGTITFTHGTTGCVSTATVIVNDTPTIAPHPSIICHTYMGLILSATPPGGVWSSSNPFVAGINPTTGQVTPTGLFFGSVRFTYTLPTGCDAEVWIEIRDCGIGGGIGGWRSCICPGEVRALTLATGGAAPGGVWASSNPSVATINPTTGVVTGVGPGTTTITYTVGGVTYTVTMTGCASRSGCVYVAFVGTDYYFTFTATSPSCLIFYSVFDPMGNYLGSSSTFPTTMSWTSLAAVFGTTAYTVCVYRVNCNCSWTHEYWCCASVNPGTWVGTHEVENSEAELAVVPNPNAGAFELQGTFPGTGPSRDVVIEVVDMMGKTVYNTTATLTNGKMNNPLKLDNNIANGVYIVRVKTEHLSKAIRFELNR